MKTLLISCTVLLFATSACNKCYVCGSSNNQNITYCKGDPNYDLLKKGYVITDYNGQELDCHPQ